MSFSPNPESSDAAQGAAFTMPLANLSSHHVNYLVWRYLQESGFGEAAVKLQQRWIANPDSLPYSDTVTEFALVILIQKGLQFCELEQEVRLRRNVPPMILHNPAGAATIKRDDDDDDDQDTKVLIKREPEDHASLPVDGPKLEPAPDDCKITEIPEVKNVRYLAGEAAVVSTDLGEVMHAVWSPADPSCLATAGMGALARVWRFKQGQLALFHSDNSEVLQAVGIPGPHGRAPWVVGSMAWHPNGDKLAVAAHNTLDVFDHQVALWQNTGALLTVYATSAMPAVELQWNPPGSILLGVCASDHGSEVQLWEPLSGDLMDTLPLNYMVDQCSWAGPDTFWLYGERTLELYRFASMGCSALASFNLAVPDLIYIMRADPNSQLAVTSSAHGYIDIWDIHGRMTSFKAYDSPVTALEWQPDYSLFDPLEPPPMQPRRLFAAASLDGTVRIFNGYMPWQCVHMFPFGLRRYPVVAMAFSPHGNYIAAASPGKVLIWDIDGTATLCASWNSSRQEQATASSSSPGSSSSDQQQPPQSRNPFTELVKRPYQLSWNSEEDHLCYASRSQLAIIPFKG